MSNEPEFKEHVEVLKKDGIMTEIRIFSYSWKDYGY
jgi:hypothetical protein